MTTLERAKSLAEETLKTYELAGRKLPEDITTWTPPQRRLLRSLRDAYYAALTTYNALREDAHAS